MLGRCFTAEEDAAVEKVVMVRSRTAIVVGVMLAAHNEQRGLFLVGGSWERNYSPQSYWSFVRVILALRGTLAIVNVSGTRSRYDHDNGATCNDYFEQNC